MYLIDIRKNIAEIHIPYTLSISYMFKYFSHFNIKLFCGFFKYRWITTTSIRKYEDLRVTRWNMRLFWFPLFQYEKVLFITGNNKKYFKLFTNQNIYKFKNIKNSK